MGIILAWYPNPDPNDIDIETWNRFLNNYAPVLLILIAMFIVLTVYLYNRMASNLRIHSVNDVFRSYTPMRALWCGLAGATISGVVAAVMYWDMVETAVGNIGFSLTMFLLTLLFCESISFSIVAYVRGLTPPQFCYRPSRLLQKKGPAR